MSSVRRCRRLQSLRLHGCALGAAGAQALVHAFKSKPNEGSNEHALRDVDISGNGIPEADMLTVLDALPHAVAADGPFPQLKTFIIAANPEVEGPAVAGRVEALVELGVVIMRAANDGDMNEIRR
jgi:hypothetical protein